MFGADLVTFAFAVLTLLPVRIPDPGRPDAGERRRSSVWADAREGWGLLRDRRGLIVLLGTFAVLNCALALCNLLFVPLVLSFSNAAGVGIVMSAGGAGALITSALLGMAPQPRRLVPATFAAIAVIGVALVAIAVRPTLPAAAGAAAPSVRSLEVESALARQPAEA